MNLEYFQLIDRITVLDAPARSIAVEARVPASSTIFEGHFPGHPIMPGVLLCEAMAQTSGWLILGMGHFERMPFLAGIKSAKLRSFVEPGMDLDITAHLVHDGSGYAMTKARIRHQDKTVADAELTFTLAPFPSPDFAVMMRQWGKKLHFPYEMIHEQP